MAKVNIEYDSNDKTGKVHIDGKEVPNVHAVSLDKRYTDKGGEAPKYQLSLHQMEKDAAHDMTCYHHTMAKEDVPADKQAVAADVSELPGYQVVTTTEKGMASKEDVPADDSKAVKQIVSWFTDEE